MFDSLSHAFAWTSGAEGWIALATLTVLEIVLGIDNIVFISILAGKLRVEEREKARKVGLSLAMFIRIGLLLSITWVMGLTAPLFSVARQRDLGPRSDSAGRRPVPDRQEHARDPRQARRRGGAGDARRSPRRSPRVIIQILLLDIVFSLDSVITAVGMAEHVSIMILAVIISVGVMLISSGPISDFVEQHPTVKMLALSFLLLIGVSLIGEGLDQHIPKGYIYFAMGFSIFVEMLNLRVRKKSEPVHLHQSYTEE